jgi:hypothetical protein
MTLETPCKFEPNLIVFSFPLADAVLSPAALLCQPGTHPRRSLPECQVPTEQEPAE